MGILDERTIIGWLGGFGGMLPRGNFWNLSVLNVWKCIGNVSNVTPVWLVLSKTVTMAVKPRNFHDMTPPKDANYLKMPPHKLPISRKWPPQQNCRPPLTGNKRPAPKYQSLWKISQFTPSVEMAFLAHGCCLSGIFFPARFSFDTSYLIMVRFGNSFIHFPLHAPPHPSIVASDIWPLHVLCRWTGWSWRFWWSRRWRWPWRFWWSRRWEGNTSWQRTR